MPSQHNFILDNGAIAHNCAHAVSYSSIAYTCAYIKHYFPMEWWCSVLCNATKNEVSEKFFKHCKQWIDLPDIRHSGEKWEIQNGRIRAPISLIQGIGEKAQIELCKGRPYSNIQDFCNRIIEVKKSGAKLNKNNKLTLGKSALNYGVISKLIISGVADSLFEPNLTVYEKLMAYKEAYQSAHKNAFNKKGTPIKIDESFNNLTTLNRFQYTKQILPIYSQDLIPLTYDIKFNGIERARNKTNFDYLYNPKDRLTLDYIRKQSGSKKELEALPIVNGAQLQFLNKEVQTYEGQLITCAAICLITSIRKFSFTKEGKIKHALELVVDVDNEQFKFVKWGPREGGQVISPDNLEGSVALLVLSKFKQDRPLSCDAVVIIQQPLDNLKDLQNE